jgi:RNA polymerase sigma factor (sigma-70 family)
MRPGAISALMLRAQPDERLVRLAREQLPIAFAVLVERHRERLLAHSVRLVGSQRAEDVLQLSLLRAWRALLEGREVDQPAAWLHRILHNVAITELTASGARAEPLEESYADPISTELRAHERIELGRVLAAVSALPPRQRLALLGTELQGRSRRQLAGELGISEDAVRGLVHRARSGVKATLGALVPWPFLLRLSRLAHTRAVTELRAQAHGTPELLSGGGTAVGLLKAATATLLAIGALGGAFALHTLHGLSRAAPMHRGYAGARARVETAASPPDSASALRLAVVRPDRASAALGVGRAATNGILTPAKPRTPSPRAGASTPPGMKSASSGKRAGGPGGQSTAGQAGGDATAIDQTAGDPTVDGSTAGDQTAGDQTVGDQAGGDQAGGDQTAGEQTAAAGDQSQSGDVPEGGAAAVGQVPSAPGAGQPNSDVAAGPTDTSGSASVSPDGSGSAQGSGSSNLPQGPDEVSSPPAQTGSAGD